MKRFTAVILLLVLLAIMTGCQPADPADDPGPEVTGPASPVTLPPAESQSTRDTIRLAIRQEGDLDPFKPQHYTTDSLLGLVYEPLFEVSYDGRLQGRVASSFRWSYDGLELVVNLDGNRYFHDGRQLGPQDALASLQAYLAASLVEPEEETADEAGSVSFQPELFSGIEAWKHKSLENIISVSVNGLDQLVISLEEADPLLPRLLTFPLVPGQELESGGRSQLTGSGSWQIDSWTADHLRLSRTDRQGRVRVIEAKAYPDAVRAAYDFENGNLDLFLMDASETVLFGDRSRIRKQRFEDGGFISLFFSDRRGDALAKRDALLYVLGSDPELSTIASPHAHASFPLLRGDFRLEGRQLAPIERSSMPEGYGPSEEQLPDDQAGIPAPSDRPAFTLLVPRGFVPTRLLDRLSTALLGLDRQLLVRAVKADDWFRALREDVYDAVLLVDTAVLFPDPADYLDGLETLGLYSWTDRVGAENRQLLLEARARCLEPGDGERGWTASAYAEAVRNTFEDLPVIGLASTGTMVWYSSDVEGSLTGDWRVPYRDLEELFLWK